jgi:hypothetical protein
MANYGGPYQQGGFQPSAYPQNPQYGNTTGGVNSSAEYSPPAGFATAGQMNQAPGGYNHPNQGTGHHVDSAYDSMSPSAPSSGTLSNATPGYSQGIGHGHAQNSYPGGVPPGLHGHSMSPSPANDEYKWWIPSEGISRNTLYNEIQFHLGRDALYRLGTGRGDNDVCLSNDCKLMVANS